MSPKKPYSGKSYSRRQNMYHRTDRKVMRNSYRAAKQRKRHRILSTMAALIVVGAIVVGAIHYSEFLRGIVPSPENTATATSQNSKQQTSEKTDEPQDSEAESTPLLSNQFIKNTDRLTADQKKTLKDKLNAKYMYLYDVTADEVLYEKDSHKKLYPASTTKILTAITASQIITDKDQVFTVGNEIEMIGEESSTAGLEKGMKLTFEMLMDALLLPSGNDAAYTIAVNCGRIYENNPKLSNKEAVKVFVEQMNNCAKELGATETHFVTPDGFHNKNHYTTAADLAKFATYSRTIPIIKNSYSKSYAKWKLKKGGTVEWYNSNLLLQDESSLYNTACDGIKTGFTDEAGSCLVASATLDQHTLIAVVMNGETFYSKYNDTNLLLGTGFQSMNLEYSYTLLDEDGNEENTEENNSDEDTDTENTDDDE